MTARTAMFLACVLLPAIGRAQANVPIQMPKALLFPNFDNVLLGKDQALEGGAYIARASDASSNFYNPAGLVQSEKSSLNASSTGWVQTKLTSEALGHDVTSSKVDNVPGYFGAVIDPPWIGMRNLRIGFSLTRLVAWAPGPIDQSAVPTGGNGLDRITYSSAGSFATHLYQGAVAWSPFRDRALRVGLSFGAANTSYNSQSTLSGLTTVGGTSGQFLSTLRANGSQWNLVIGGGVQWDAFPGFTVGAIVRAPGIAMGSSSLLTYESAILGQGAPTTSFFRDDAGQFQYKLPLEAGLGVAYRFGDFQFEADLRFHDAPAAYDLYRSSVPLQVLTHNPDGTITPTTQPVGTFTHASRQVFNVAVGGNYRLSRVVTVHGGFYTSMSPVDDPARSPFRQADLYGITAGVDAQYERFGASLGAGYQFGSAPATGFAINDQKLAGSSVTLQAISLLYAISFQF